MNSAVHEKIYDDQVESRMQGQFNTRNYFNGIHQIMGLKRKTT